MSEKTKESAVVPENQQLIDCLDEHIKKIAHEECGRILWNDLNFR